MTLRTDRTGLIESALAGFGGPAALSLSMALWSYPVTIFTVVWVGWAVAGPSPWWFVIATVVQLEYLLLGWLARPWLLPRLRAKPRPGLMLVFFVVLGVIRGSITVTLIPWLGLQPVEQVGFRLLGGPIITVVTAFFVAWAIDTDWRHRELMAELRGIGDALGASRDHLSDLLLADRQRILSEVDATLTGPLSELREVMARGEAAATEAAVRINMLIDETVKPLSRELATEVPSWLPAPTAITVRKERWRSRISGARVRRPLLPGMHAGVLAAIAPSVLAAEMPFSDALISALVGGGGAWLVLTAAEQLRRRLLGARGLVASAISVAVASALATLPMIVMLAIFIPGERDVVTYQQAAVVAMQLAGFGLLTISLTEQLRAEAEERLRSSNAELAIHVARVSGELWTQQNRISQLLHGPVQTALILAVARLSAADRGQTELPDAESLLAPVNAALAELATVAEQQQDFAFFLKQLRSVWRDAMELEERIDAGVLEVLAVNPATSAVLVAIVRELVNNAYRHGNSSQVQITVEFDGAEAVRLQVVSDGPGPDEWSGIGLGSQLLDAAAISWSRQGGLAGVDVVAVLPIGRQQPVLPPNRAGSSGETDVVKKTHPSRRNRHDLY